MGYLRKAEHACLLARAHLVNEHPVKKMMRAYFEAGRGSREETLSKAAVDAMLKVPMPLRLERHPEEPHDEP